MKLKRKIVKKIPVCKAIEGKVPVAWETSKAIPDLPYSSCNQVEDYEWSAGNKWGYKLQCRISEEEHVVWYTPGIVDELVFVQATLQNVEWGKNCRTYRYQPKVNVCEKVNELKVVKKGIESEIVFEMVTEFDTLTLEQCKIRINIKCKSGNKTTKKENIQFDKEHSERIDDPTTRNSQQIEQIPIEKDLKSSCQIKYKLSEEEPEVWGLECGIPDLVYEHALLQNVDFEWGNNSRPYRYQPTVNKCEKINELSIVKTGIESRIVFEMAKEFDTFELEKCKIKMKRKYGRKSTKMENIAIYEDRAEPTNDSTTRNNQQIEQLYFDPQTSRKIKYKLSEEEPEVWGLEFITSELVYEHALLQNVEFEWGTWGRPVKIRLDVWGKEVEHKKVKKAEQTEIVFEMTNPFPAVIFENCKVTEPERVKIMYLIINECKNEKDLPNFIYRNSKFFCKSCNEYICNSCFTTDCMNHDVQWLGNATFRCESPYHKQI